MKLSAESTLGAPFGSAAAVEGFTQAGVRLQERADLACLLLSTGVESAAVVDAASRAVGLDLPRTFGAVQVQEPHLALWLSPRSWLVLGDLASEGSLAARVAAAFPEGNVHAAHFTDYLCWLELSGPRTLELLGQLSFVSLERAGLPAGHAKRTLVAGIPAVVFHRSDEVWLIGVERSRARYFADRLATVVLQ